MPDLCKVRKPNSSTIATPLTGCYSSPYFVTKIDNASYASAFAKWIVVDTGLDALKAFFTGAVGAPAPDATLQLLVKRLTTVDPISGFAPITLPGSSLTNGVIARAVSIASNTLGANLVDGFKYFNTNAVASDKTKVNVLAVADIVLERVFASTSGSTTGGVLDEILGRGHLSEIFEIAVFVSLKPDLLITVDQSCPAANNPTVTPGPFACLPDESSEEECDNRYGFGSFPFPFLCTAQDPSRWSPL